MTGMAEGVAPSAISAEAYATPSTTSAETGGIVGSLNSANPAVDSASLLWVPDAQISNVQ